MADNTGIEWADATWGPVTGCDRVSPGCDHCYALTMAKRLKAMGSAKYQTDGNPATSGPGFGLAMHESALDQPLRWRRPRKVFVNSMSDLFHKDVTDEFIARVFAVMALAPQHTFQILSKRPGRMRSLLGRQQYIRVPSGWLSFEDAVKNIAFNERNRLRLGSAPNPDDLPWPLPNVWMGVSVEDQHWADIRIPLLLGTPAAVRFLSCEPLLGPVDLRPHMPWDNSLAADPWGIGWVIVGGESGKGARPMHPAWARQLRDQCGNAGVPFLFKQYGEWAPGFRNVQMSKDRWQYESIRFAPDGTVYRGDQPDLYSYPGMESVLRVGKHKAGRVLDGRTWDEYPEAVTV